MQIIRPVLTVFACAALAGVASVSVAQAQGLNEVLAETYNTNPELQAARAELRAVDETVSQAYSGYRPEIAVVGTTLYSTTDRPDERFDLFTNEIGLNLTQNIYEGGGTVAAVRSAVNQVGQQRAVLQSVEQGVFLDAVTAYTDVVASARVVELAINNEERLQRQLQATQDRFEVGEVTRTDVAQAEASLAGAQADLVSAQGLLAQAVAAFEAVVGFRPGELTTTFPGIQAPASLDEADARSANNPTIIASRFAVQVAEADVRVAQADLLPSIDLFGDVSYASNPSIFFDRQTEARVGATISIPIYQGGAVYSLVRQTKQVLQQTRDELEDARRSVRELVTQAWEGLETASATAVSFEEQTRANQIALEGVETEAQVGARTVLDVLDAEQALFESQVDLVEARATEVVALYTLQSAMGELTAEALGLEVEIYDPDVHYQEVDTQAFGTEPGRATLVVQEIDFSEEWSLPTPE